jgi:hypothetical protein
MIEEGQRLFIHPRDSCVQCLSHGTCYFFPEVSTCHVNMGFPHISRECPFAYFKRVEDH